MKNITIPGIPVEDYVIFYVDGMSYQGIRPLYDDSIRGTLHGQFCCNYDKYLGDIDEIYIISRGRVMHILYPELSELFHTGGIAVVRFSGSYEVMSEEEFIERSI